MIYTWNTFLKPLSNESRNISISGMNEKFIINPFFATSPHITNNILKIKTKDHTIDLQFSSPNEAKLALRELQNQIDILKNKKPINTNAYIDNIVSSAHHITYNGSLDIRGVGAYISITIERGLLFKRGQSVLIFNDFQQFYVDDDYVELNENNYMICHIDTYNKESGLLNLVVTESMGRGNYDSWYIYLT